jgi:hypothetical protein
MSAETLGSLMPLRAFHYARLLIAAASYGPHRVDAL